MADDVFQHKADLAAAIDAMKKATAIREKESAAYKEYAKEAGVNLDSVNKAVAALVKGMGGSFLQSGAAQVVQRVAFSSQDLSDEDRQDVLAFLTRSSSYTSGADAGDIVGILKAMAASLDKAIGEASRAEAASSKSYDDLMSAKKKEVDSLNESIRIKTQRGGELAVTLVQLEEDLEATEKGLAQDSKFSGDMARSCATKEGEYKKESETRQQELVAVAETIKILNDDEAQELLKKTLPSDASSFLQLTASAAQLRKQAVVLLQKARSAQAGDHTQLDFIVLALHGKKIGFDSVIAKIDTLLKELKKEEQDDVSKRVYCRAELDRSEDKSKSLERDISDEESEIASEKEDLAALSDDLGRLGEHIKELDGEVAEATEQRKEEHSAYLEELAANTAAKQLLEFAKQRLQQFYGASFSQMSDADEQPSGPGSGSYKKKTDEFRSILAMLDSLIADIVKDMAAAKTEEDDSQADYQVTMNEAKEKRSSDSKSLMLKEKTKADVSSQLGENIADKKDMTKDLMTSEQYLASIHKACDWLLRNFEARRSARKTEMENLNNAKMVLAGVDASLLQSRSQHFLQAVS